MALSEAVKASIVAELNHQGVSQRELARRLGVKQQYVWRRISDSPAADKEFTPSEVERVAEALGVPVSRFLSARRRLLAGSA